MIYLLLVLVVGTVIAALIGGITSKKGVEEPINEAKDSCATCSGIDDMCQHTCTLKKAIEPIDYFDDEELDMFIGRASDQYHDDEVEQFAEVLRTMQPTEVADWVKSLSLRSINLPNELKDEARLLMTNE